MAIVAKGQITLTKVTNGDTISVSIKGGVRGISYAADGSNPNPSTSTPFSIEFLKNGVLSTPYSYRWTSGGNVSGSSNKETFTPLISSSFISGNSFVMVEIKEKEDSLPIIEVVPIVSTKFANGLDWINEWDSTATVIKDNKVITPKIFAGKNESINEAPLLTGVAIGVDVLGEIGKTVGVVGYYQNDPRFKLDTNGNFFVGSGWGAISSGIGGGIKYNSETKKLVISGDIDVLSGSIKDKDVDSILSDIDSSLNTIENWGDRSDDGSTIVSIKGGAITANSITADKLSVKGLTVKDDNGVATFSIAQNGEVMIDGTLSSGNFSLLNKTGYSINRDGSAILNQATIRGTVQLPEAGITDDGNLDKSIRFWAGASFDNRAFAPFKVYQDGSLEAFDGIFNGNIFGDYDNNFVHIRKNSIYIDEEARFYSNKDFSIISELQKDTVNNRFIHFSTEQSVINTDLYFGTESDKDFEYLKQQKQITTNTKNISRTSLGSIIMNYDYDTDYHILNTSGGNGGSHDIRYEKNSGGLIFESDGSSIANRQFDYKFKKPSGDVVVSVEGSIDLKKGITSPKNNIEMRATSTGFAFYAI